MRSGAARALLGSLLFLAPAACVPRAKPLAGEVAPARLPDTALRGGPRQISFRWRYEEGEFGVSGDGVARILPPDSVRLDFFIGGGLGSGRALLLGDTLITSGGDEVRRFLPPAPLLWASLGRLSLPPAADTTARVDGDTLRADIGRGPVWRVTFAAGQLASLVRIDGGRIVERVDRRAGGTDLHYENARAHRSLSLTVTRDQQVAGFDADIWLP